MERIVFYDWGVLIVADHYLEEWQKQQKEKLRSLLMDGIGR